MTFFLCVFVFGSFLKTTFLTIRDNGKIILEKLYKIENWNFHQFFYGMYQVQ